MKETDFIQQNNEKWAKIEANLNRKGRFASYDNLSDSFVELSEDLSYAQTYYGRRTVRVFLNNMGQRLYKKVFNTQAKSKTAKLRFWTHELPTALYESRIEMLVALAVFALAVFIGVVSSKYDDSFANQILGDGYVNMTEENIAKGDPMGVYKKMDFFEMFFRILLNNLQVSVFTFILGLLAGAGTIGILVSNGIMLGVFQYFFVQRNIGFESFLTIWQHGTIEIASIIVAGGAGLVLGRSIIFPGTLPRGISLKFGALKGLKVLMGVAPLILIAAFIESFYTRYDDLPMAFRLATILASLAFVFGYYVWLPIKRGRNASLLADIAPDYTESHISYTLDLRKLKSVGEILGDALVIVQRNLWAFFKVALIPALALALVVVVFLHDDFNKYYHFTSLRGDTLSNFALVVGEVFVRLTLFGELFDFGKYLFIWPIMALLSLYISVQSGRFVYTLFEQNKPEPIRKGRAIMPLTVNYFLHLLLLAPFLLSLWYMPFYLLFTLPTAGTAWFVMLLENVSAGKSFQRAAGMVFRGLLRNIGTVLIGLLFSLLAAMLIQSPTFYILFELGNGFIGISEGPAIIIEFIIIAISLTTLFCGLTFTKILCMLNFFSVREIIEAPQLLAQIAALKLSRK